MRPFQIEGQTSLLVVSLCFFLRVNLEIRGTVFETPLSTSYFFPFHFRQMGVRPILTPEGGEVPNLTVLRSSCRTPVSLNPSV